MSEFRKKIRNEFQDKEYAHAYIDEFLNDYIATQIKVLREQRGWTQEILADIAEMKQSRIALLENVNYDKWSIFTLKKLSEAFDVTLKVSFETFSDRIEDIENFSRGSLERETREKDLTNIKIEPPIVLHTGTKISFIADSKSTSFHDKIELALVSEPSNEENIKQAI